MKYYIFRNLKNDLTFGQVFVGKDAASSVKLSIMKLQSESSPNKLPKKPKTDQKIPDNIICHVRKLFPQKFQLRPFYLGIFHPQT